jgi:hypothetical protein
MHSQRTSLGALSLLAIIIWNAAPALSQTTLSASAIVVDLRSHGWEPPTRHEITRPSIAIDRDGRVLVSFSLQERDGLVTRNQPSLNFRILRFGRDGKADLSLSLPTNAGGKDGIYLSDTDQVIARSDDKLQLLQTDAESQKTVWKTLAPCGARCSIKQSLTRRTLLLYTEDADPPLTLIRLSLQPELRRCGMAYRLRKSAEDVIQNIPQITDQFGYFHGWEPMSGGFTYRWPLCDYEHRIEMPIQILGHWTVMNDDVFVDVNSNRKGDQKLEVTSSDGRVKFRPIMLKHESAGSLWTPIRGSERGERIAVDMLTVRGRNQKLDIGGHVTARRIAVYDTGAGKEIASISVNPKHSYDFEFDLSPDGRYLAILEDDQLKVVTLEEIVK